MASTRKMSKSVGFIETMDCRPVPKVPEGEDWTYEIKLDGYRLEAIKSRGKVTVYSRRRIHYAFDVLAHKGKSLLENPLTERRELLEQILPGDPAISLSVVDARSATQVLEFVRRHGLEGVIAKRADSPYEPGKRSGLWTKTRIDMGQEFVVGGYTPGSNGFDALLIGFYQGQDFVYAAKVRAGFVPASRREVGKHFQGLKTNKCPFVNLPETDGGRWGEGLTADKMRDCTWLKLEIVARIDFREWTGASHLRHTKFVALRDDKDPKKVVRET